MDVAYDHIQEDAFSPSSPPRVPPQISTTNSSDPASTDDNAQAPSSPTLNAELQSAFKTIQSSPWGTTIGGWFTTARKQGEDFYEGLQKEAAEAQEEALKGFSSLREQVVNRTRGLSLTSMGNADETTMTATQVAEAKEKEEESAMAMSSSSASGAAASSAAEAEALQERSSMEGLSLAGSDIVKEAGTLVASLRSTAASKLKDLQKAEDAADEALLKFGTNVRNFLRDAVTISAPDEATLGAQPTEVLFETQEPGTGRKVVHATRLDAQLHAIHNAASSFTEDPVEGEKWEVWTGEFDIDRMTGEIAKDLEKYEGLRRAMERLVPEVVEYRKFWMRYYFLRQAVEEEERRRREVLKGAATTGTEEVSWDADSDDDEPSTPHRPSTAIAGNNAAASISTTTLNAAPSSNQGPSITISPRRSNEDEKRSVADSDASYDMVSGATSRAPGSPTREGREDSDDDDDWE